MMKKMNKILKSKKGAALVAVLIGILFITILASSLLYMSTMNMHMKNMREYSTDNFYTAEYVLDDMLSQVKQLSGISDKPREALEHALQVKHADDGSNYDHFNEAYLQSLVDVDSVIEGIESIEISSIYKTADKTYTQATYKTDAAYIYLLGVQIKVKTDEAHGAYESTITTDIAFGFPVGGSGKLNDFSILSDTPIWFQTSNQFIGGNLYCRANNSEVGAGTAFRVGGGSSPAVVTLMSTFAFIDGDIRVQSGGALMVYGNVFVHGNVKVEGTGQMLVGGQLHVSGSTTGVIKETGSGSIDHTGNWDYYGIPSVCPDCGRGSDWYVISPDKRTITCKNCYPDLAQAGKTCGYSQRNFKDGLAHHLVADTLCVHLQDSTVAMSGYEGTRDCLKLTQAQFATKMQVGSSSKGLKVTGSVDGHDVSAIYLTNNVEHNESNTLIISGTNFNNFHGYMKNCTVLVIDVYGNNTNCLKVSDVTQHANSWGTMDDNSYNTAKELMFSGQMDNFDGGLTPDYPTSAVYATSATPIINAGVATGEYSLTVGGASKTVRRFGGSDSQPYYCDGTTNYFPYKCFLNDNLESVLGAFKKGSDEGADANAQPVINLINWTKE